MTPHKFPLRFLTRAAVLVLAMLAAGLLYQSQENFIPFSDSYRCIHQFQWWQDCSGLSLVSFYRDIGNAEYNSLYLLPFLLLGKLLVIERDGLILCITVFYGFLYLLAYGHLVKTVEGHGSLDRVGYPALLGGLLFPPLLFTTFQGYETIASLPFLTFALSFYLHGAYSEDSPPRRLSSFVLSGIFIMSAFIIRRPFVYIISAFYAGACVFLAGELVTGKVRPRSREGLLRLVGLILSVLSSFTLAAVLIPDRLRFTLATPYRAIYKGYEFPPMAILQQLALSAGVLFLVLSLSGYLAYIRLARNDAGGRKAGHLLLVLAIGVTQWIVMAGYTLFSDKVLPFAPFLGMGVSLFLLKFGGGFKRPLGIAVTLLLATNMAVSLGGLGSLGRSAPMRALFAKPLPPVNRDDIPQVKALIGRLRELTARNGAPPGPVYVVASSPYINSQLLSIAEAMFFGRKQARLVIPPVPQVDRKDNYPVYPLFADWVVTVTPLQTHIDPEEQLSVAFALWEFVGRGPVSSDFEAAGPPVELRPAADEGPLTVQVYRRIRPTSLPKCIDYMERAKRFIKHPPVFDNLWVLGYGGVERRYLAKRLMVQGERYQIELVPDERPDSSPVFLLRPISRGERLSGAVIPAGETAAAEIHFTLFDYGGCKKGLQTILARYDVKVKGRQVFPFTIKYDFPQNALLAVGVEPWQGTGAGKIRIIMDLTIERAAQGKR